MNCNGAFRKFANIGKVWLCSVQRVVTLQADPDVLSYDKDAYSVELDVVQRKVEMPSEQGFGFTELYYITLSAGGIFDDNKVQELFARCSCATTF